MKEPPVRSEDNAPERARFVVDGRLGVLARYLRLMGYDTILGHGGSDGDGADAAELALTARRENRTLLTRDEALLERGASIHCCVLGESDPRLQLREVLRRPEMAVTERPFTRCIACNVPLDEAEGHVGAPGSAAAGTDPAAGAPEGYTGRAGGFGESFRRCPSCRRAYWPGPDEEHLGQLVRSVLEQLGDDAS